MKCHVCGTTIVKEVPVLNLKLREALPDDVIMPFYQCTKCSNASCDILDKAFHLERYKGWHEWSRKDEKEALSFFRSREEKQKWLNKKIVRYILKTLPINDYRYLEIGCAEGVLLETLVENSRWDVRGVEIATKRAEWGKKHGRPIISGAFSRDLFEAGSFHVISIHETLDHFHDIVEVLGDIRHCLTGGGYLTVVNTVYRWPEEQKKNRFHHSTYFTHDGLVNMFKANGFNLIKAFNLPHRGLHWHQRLFRGEWGLVFRHPRMYRRFWSKHLLIGQKMDSPIRPFGKVVGNEWKWTGRRFKPMNRKA